MQTTFASKKVNSINTITVIIEPTFMGNFSILAFDEEGGIFIEKFADTLAQAEIVAGKLFKKVIAKY